MNQELLHKLYKLSNNTINDKEKDNVDKMIYALELGIAKTMEEAFIKRNNIKI